MSKFVQPTVGRVVWYWPSEEDLEFAMSRIHEDQPFKADVLCVNPNGTVNLTVTDHEGSDAFCGDVQLFQDGETYPDRDGLAVGYACWMPFQIAQHAKQT